jgi:glutamate-1-semialdehyde 2,1-aminomutase
MTRSSDLFHQALQRIPGGVNSPVRAFKGVGGDPIFFKQGKGAYLEDEDGRSYIDYVCSWGALILGHAPHAIISAVEKVLHQGTSFGAPTLLEIQLAEKICSLMPHIEKIRMVNSGTEATMTAIRLARAVTKKDKIIKLNGCYHGHSDGLLVNAGSGLLTLGIPSTPGIPQSVTMNTLTVDFNNLDQVAQCFEQFPEEIAAIILEPIAGNMGFVTPRPDFLQGLRQLCDQYQALLIFDEVMTGFRVALGGAQAIYNIKPDLTTLGKVIGGGMPVGAVGGRAQWMSFLAPEGPVYQAGTLSGNPLAMAAGLASLTEIEKPGFFDALNQTSKQLVQALSAVAQSLHCPLWTGAVGGMFGFCFTEQEEIRNYAEVAASDLAQFKMFYHGMLAEGIYFAPSMFEAGFISSAHGPLEIQKTQAAAEKVLSLMGKEKGND